MLNEQVLSCAQHLVGTFSSPCLGAKTVYKYIRTFWIVFLYDMPQAFALLTKFLLASTYLGAVGPCSLFLWLWIPIHILYLFHVYLYVCLSLCMYCIPAHASALSSGQSFIRNLGTVGPYSWFYDCGSLYIFCIFSMYICICLFVYLGTVGPCFWFYDCWSLLIFSIYSMYICTFVCLYVWMLLHLPNPLAKAKYI